MHPLRTISEIYNNIKNANSPCPSSLSNFAILKLAIEDPTLKSQYENRIEEHNEKFVKNKFMDSGFDLVVPGQVIFENPSTSKFIDMKVKAEMCYCDVTINKISTCAFAIYPRSSISKMPLLLANHTGIIDSGYRGSLIAAIRSLQFNTYTVDPGTRLVQICHPTLCPIYVVAVNEDELSTSERGDGGFGSTN